MVHQAAPYRRGTDSISILEGNPMAACREHTEGPAERKTGSEGKPVEKRCGWAQQEDLRLLQEDEYP